MFDKLKGVTKSVRNLPPDPTVDPNAPSAADPDADDNGMTCPQCGASLSLKAVAKPTPAAAAPDTSSVIPAKAPMGAGPDGGGQAF